jgi:hypothetical protein
METSLWPLGYIANTVFCLWVLLWGGAEWLEGKFISGFLISFFAPKWTADQIKIAAFCGIILNMGFFIFGLFFTEWR